ncbi:MAG: enoyl-CoA hydratase-related protein, partial [Bacteroidota bacterium]
NTAQIQSIHQEHFAFLQIEESDHVLTITLNRAAKKNALHPQMVNELAFAMHYAQWAQSVWIVVFQAQGNVFCAGADLKAMMGLAEEHDSSIPLPKGDLLLGELFNELHKPSIAKVSGDVFAGGFFFLAGCTIVLAQNNIRLGLPEVKRGLFPFQVMEALLKVMPARKVMDWCVRGYDLSVQEALNWGLVTELCAADQLEQRLHELIDELRANSPTAMRNGLAAYQHIRPSSAQHAYLLKMLMQTMSTADGQEGLRAFREKRAPVWTGQ